jgi:hypothetical protein
MSVEKFNSKTVITHEQIPFTQVNRHVIQKIKNMQAGFVWVYLLSMPSDWKVVKEHIKNHFKVGDLKLKQIFVYLNEHNLIEYEQVKDEKTKKIIQWNIHVLNGSKFIEKPGKNKKKTTGSKTIRMETHTYGNQGTTYKTSYKEDKNIQRGEGVDKSPILFSDFNVEYYKQIFSSLFSENNLSPDFVLKKFKTYYQKRKLFSFCDDDVRIWIVREIEYTKNKGKFTKETRSTVKEYVHDVNFKRANKDTAVKHIKRIRETISKDKLDSLG